MGSQPKTTLLIFDCDGVLIDSERLIAEVESELRTELGFPITPEEYLKKFVGHSTHSRIYADDLKRLPPDYFATVTKRVREKLEAELKPLPGVTRILDELSLPTAVASSSTPEELEFALKTVGLYERFAGRIFSVTMVGHPKPAPDVYLYAAEQTGHKPGNCLVIEDSVVGVRSAVAAGMQVVGFTGASHTTSNLASELCAAGAREIFASMEEFRQHLIELGLIPSHPTQE